MAFTGHAVIATKLAKGGLLERGADGFGGTSAPDILRGIAGPAGMIGVTDVTHYAPGTIESTLPVRTDLDDHPRVIFARRVRSEVTVYGDDRGFVTLGTGMAGTEFSIVGSGRTLIADALGLVPFDSPLFASVSPGNARSLRAFLGYGFTPLVAKCLSSRRGNLMRAMSASGTEPTSS